MALNIDKKETYANPYYTNWFYLDNMTEFQVKLLEEMTWNEKHIINANAWGIPNAQASKRNAKITINLFIGDLNEKIMEL